MKQLIFTPLILEEWKETRDTLQKYCRLVGAIRETLSRPLPCSLHTNLLICRNGFTTSLIPKNEQSPDQLFEVIIDLIHKRLRIESNYREPLYIALTGQSLNALCDETCSLLTDEDAESMANGPFFVRRACDYWWHIPGARDRGGGANVAFAGGHVDPNKWKFPSRRRIAFETPVRNASDRADLAWLVSLMPSATDP